MAVQEDIVNAMALTGQVLMGQSVMVKSSEVGSFPLGPLLHIAAVPVGHGTRLCAAHSVRQLLQMTCLTYHDFIPCLLLRFPSSFALVLKVEESLVS